MNKLHKSTNWNALEDDHKTLFKIYLESDFFISYRNVKLQKIQIMEYRMGKQEYKNPIDLKFNVSTLRFETWRGLLQKCISFLIKATFSLGASTQIHRTFQRFKRIS